MYFVKWTKKETICLLWICSMSSNAQIIVNNKHWTIPHFCLILFIKQQKQASEVWTEWNQSNWCPCSTIYQTTNSWNHSFIVTIYVLLNFHKIPSVWPPSFLDHPHIPLPPIIYLNVITHNKFMVIVNKTHIFYSLDPFHTIYL